MAKKKLLLFAALTLVLSAACIACWLAVSRKHADHNERTNHERPNDDESPNHERPLSVRLGQSSAFQSKVSHAIRIILHPSLATLCIDFFMAN